MVVDLITIFPAMVEAMLADGVVGRARARGVIEIGVRDLRDYTDDRHRTVDDVPFGGGPGMVMKPEPIARAIEAVAAQRGAPAAVVMLTPQGRPFTQADARRLSGMSPLVFICGRYEGVDERVTEAYVTEEISIGDFVVSGGEWPALIVVDAMARCVPGVVGDAASVAEDSFERGLLDHPHYTRPAVWRGRAVPDVLISGHHGEIDRWRARSRVARTRARRPDVMAAAALTPVERSALAELEQETNGHEGD